MPLSSPQLSPFAQPIRIVLIEDHAFVRHLLGVMLSEDPALELAGDYGTVQEGIAGGIALAPDLVIVDWTLPDGLGIEVVRTLLAKLPRTRFLILSSLEKEHVVREAIDAGVHGFVMKRASYEMLLEAIRAVASGQSFYCPTSSRLLVESLRFAAETGVDALTGRERDILRSIARGESIKMIAGRLGLSPKTINNQFGALKDKLGIRDTAGLVRYAVRRGLVEDF